MTETSWSPQGTRAGYKIKHHSPKSGTPVTVSVGPETGYTLSAGLMNGFGYTIVVRAVNGWGDGPWSEPWSDAKPRTTPGPPGDVEVIPGNGRLVVTWSPPLENGGADITSYQVEYSTDKANSGTVGAGAGTRATILGLNNEFT